MKYIHKTISVIFGLSMFFILQGCVTHAPFTQDEWTQIVKAQHFDEDDKFNSYTTRVVERKSVADVLAASEELFILSDGNDMKFENTENGVSAMRYWYVWAIVAAISGWDYWGVSAHPSEENPENTLVTISQSSESMGQMAGFSTGNVMFNGGMSNRSKLYTDEAAYQLIWNRLEYLLGLTDEWISCKEAPAWVERNSYEGSLRALCEFTSDKAPESFSELADVSE